MKELKVVEVVGNFIKFENGVKLYSDHDQDCCESHYLSFEDLSLDDFNGLTFDLSGENFFNRVPGYGIELIPNHGFPVRIPGYGWNNGYYSSDLNLMLSDDNSFEKFFDISECQNIEG